MGTTLSSFSENAKPSPYGFRGYIAEENNYFRGFLYTGNVPLLLTGIKEHDLHQKNIVYMSDNEFIQHIQIFAPDNTLSPYKIVMIDSGGKRFESLLNVPPVLPINNINPVKDNKTPVLEYKPKDSNFIISFFSWKFPFEIDRVSDCIKPKVKTMKFNEYCNGIITLDGMGLVGMLEDDKRYYFAENKQLNKDSYRTFKFEKDYFLSSINYVRRDVSDSKYGYADLTLNCINGNSKKEYKVRQYNILPIYTNLLIENPKTEQYDKEEKEQLFELEKEKEKEIKQIEHSKHLNKEDVKENMTLLKEGLIQTNSSSYSKPEMIEKNLILQSLTYFTTPGFVSARDDYLLDTSTYHALKCKNNSTFLSNLYFYLSIIIIVLILLGIIYFAYKFFKRR